MIMHDIFPPSNIKPKRLLWPNAQYLWPVLNIILCIFSKDLIWNTSTGRRGPEDVLENSIWSIIKDNIITELNDTNIYPDRVVCSIGSLSSLRSDMCSENAPI